MLARKFFGSIFKDQLHGRDQKNVPSGNLSGNRTLSSLAYTDAPSTNPIFTKIITALNQQDEFKPETLVIK